MRPFNVDRMRKRVGEYVAARRYIEAVKAPMSEATITALIEALRSGDVPVRKVRRR